MDRFQVLLLVAVVGYQIFKALRKKSASEAAGTARSWEPGDPVEVPDLDRQELPEVDRTWAPAAQRPTSLPAPRKKPLPKERPVVSASACARNALREKMLGKLILDPPPGATMLRRFRQ